MNLPWMKEKSPRILVLGDVILDEYIDGSVTRISPEAPVPVHQVSHISYSLGGAANTARNIKLCGGEAFLIGAIGQDDSSKIFKNLLATDNMSDSLLMEDLSFQTIKKTRVTSLRQQLLRLDWEKKITLTSAMEKKILSHIKVIHPDVLVLSDYQKGILTKNFLQKLLELADYLHIQTIVDPKLEDFSAYKGANLITPNLMEARRALRLENENVTYEEMALSLRERFELRDVLITLGPEGMFFLGENGDSFHEKARKKEVYDVSGAGDTVVALMALCLASKLSAQESVKYANLGASLAVSKWRTQSVTASELKLALCEEEKKQEKKIVFTNGCFDVLHYGHVSYLEEAKKLGDFLVVGLNSDDSVRRLKGQSRPVNPLEYRKKTLEALRFVDLVIPFEEDTPEELIKRVSPAVLVKGDDYKKSEILGASHVLSYGGEVKTISFIKGLSSTKLIDKSTGLTQNS